MNLKSRDTHPLSLRFVGCVALVFLLGVVGCGSRGASPAPTKIAALSPAPQSTATQVPTSTSRPEPTDTPQPTPAPIDLTLVHTNDTWGYLDPCG